MSSTKPWRTTLAALVITLIALLAPASARAGVATVSQCIDEYGKAGSELETSDPSQGLVSVGSCAAQGTGFIASVLNQDSNSAYLGKRSIRFSAPTGTRLVGGRIWRTMRSYSYDVASGRDSSGLGYRLLNASGVLIERCGASYSTPGIGQCSTGSAVSDFKSPFVQLGASPTASYSLEFGCYIANRCYHRYARPGVAGIRASLSVEDLSSPTVTNAVGGLVQADVITKQTADTTVSVIDEGLGVARSRIYVDGAVVSDEPWDPTSTSCVDRDASAAFRYRSGSPCSNRPSAQRLLLPQTDDGTHVLEIRVLDAVGNYSIIRRATVTIDRTAPVVNTDPIVDGTPVAGGALGCSQTGIDAQQPTLGYQWQRARSDGSDPEDVEGATRNEYVATADDVGRKLLCRVTVTDQGGSTTRTSDATTGAFVNGATVQPAPTTPIVNPSPTSPIASPTTTGPAAAPVSSGGAENASAASATNSALAGPSGVGSVQGPLVAVAGCPAGTIVTLDGPSRLVSKRAKSATTVRGVVRSGTGAPAAGVALDLVQRVRRSGIATNTVVLGSVSSGADGKFAAAAPIGPSRDLQVISRTCGASGPLVGQTVRGSVQLRAIDKHVRNGQLARFAGRALGGFYGRGVGLELQVLVGAKWQDVRSVRTDKQGRYRTSYRFKRTYVRYTYRFRIATRAGAGWPYTATRSAIAKVRVN